MTKFDVYQTVTNQIVASIEAGTPAWRQPWTGSKGGAPFPGVVMVNIIAASMS